jgi:type I restriction enzyme S subunit
VRCRHERAELSGKTAGGVEVEWLFLSEIVELKRGKRLVKSQLSDVGKYAVYQNSMTPLGYYHQSNTSTDTTYIICAGAAGEIGFSTSPLWAADDVYYLVSPEKLSSKYIYYFLLTQKSKILSQVRRASIPRLSRTAFEKIPVPIPCPNNPEKSLAIQSEIVRILDKFTALTAELTAELTARKKQYNYYRDQLLSFDEGVVPHVPMGQEGVGEFIRGGSLQKRISLKLVWVHSLWADLYVLRHIHQSNESIRIRRVGKQMSQSSARKFGYCYN